MYLDIDQIKDINAIQLNIFKNFLEVCKRLDLKYYMAHGSLLGTIRYNGFFPFDDDIDVLMPRRDYNRLLEEGQSLLQSRYFIQSYRTEKEYPLEFAKIRDSETTFFQPIMRNFNINQGIYIDIFPLDYYPQSKLVQRYLLFKNKVYSARINSRMNHINRQSIFKKILRIISTIFCPSWENAIKKRAELYKNIRNTKEFITTGGKSKERGMPKEWFKQGKVLKFENLDVICPLMTDEYLTRIYGEYMNYNPAEKYMDRNNRVQVSADIYNVTESYKTISK